MLSKIIHANLGETAFGEVILKSLDTRTFDEKHRFPEQCTVLPIRNHVWWIFEQLHPHKTKMEAKNGFEDIFNFKLGCHIPGHSGFSWIFHDFPNLGLAESRGANRAWHTPPVFPSFEGPGDDSEAASINWWYRMVSPWNDKLTTVHYVAHVSGNAPLVHMFIFLLYKHV